MSRTLTDLGDVPAGTRWLRHPRCGRTFEVDELDTDGAERLVCVACEEAESGAGYGFIVARGRTATERAGGQPYAPLPYWLLRGEGPALDPLEFRLVAALAGFQGDRSEAWPDLGQLAAAATVRKRQTVSRALDGLVKRGLIDRWRPSKRGRYHYSVSALLRGERHDTTARARDAEQPSTQQVLPISERSAGRYLSAVETPADQGGANEPGEPDMSVSRYLSQVHLAVPATCPRDGTSEVETTEKESHQKESLAPLGSGVRELPPASSAVSSVPSRSATSRSPDSQEQDTTDRGSDESVPATFTEFVLAQGPAVNLRLAASCYGAMRGGAVSVEEEEQARRALARRNRSAAA